MDRLTGYEVLAAVVDGGGFARAARALGMSVSMTSTHVSRLEQRVGTRLLTRSTRRLELTAAGQRFLAEARSILEAVAAAESSAGVGKRRPACRVRIDAPTSLGLRYILPSLAAFRAEFPSISLDLSLGDRGTQFRLDSFDVVLRVGDIDQGDVATTHLTETHFVQVAAPDYLRARGTPKTPEDLHGHDCILYASTGSPGGNHWRFERAGKTRWLRPRAVMTFNHGDAIRAAAVAGIGVAQTLDMLIKPDLESGGLIRILKDWNRTPVPVSALAARDRAASPAVAATLGFLANRVNWQAPVD